MQVFAITKNVRMSAQKMREMVRQIQGLPAAKAQAVLAVVPRKSARVVAKTLDSAVANAEDLKEHKDTYSDMNTGALWVKEAVAQNPKSIEDYKNGKQSALGAIVGSVMKASKGQANPALVNEILSRKLDG